MTTLQARHPRGGKWRTLGVLLAVVVGFYVAIIVHHWFWPSR